MKQKFTITLPFVLFLFTCSAQWSTNSANNTPICTEALEQQGSAIVTDGQAGAIITWQDNRNGNSDIYAQRIDSAGVVQWITNGLPICTASGDQEHISVETGGIGETIITWEDYRNGNLDVYAQKVSNFGLVEWALGGVAICVNNDYSQSPKIISDSLGGAVITWHDHRNGTSDIYAQRINSAGVVQWITNGVPICTIAGDQSSPEIISDGQSGAIITWMDGRNTNGYLDVYCQRINNNGIVQWTNGGLPVCTANQSQSGAIMSTDNLGGAVIAWHDYRNGNSDIYAQRIDSAGVVQWITNGLPICTASGYQISPILIPSYTNSIILAWDDLRSGDYDIFAQKLNINGTLNCTTSPSSTFLTVCSNELPYIWNSQLINGTGIFTYTTSNNTGCDSVTILHLSVNNATSATTSISACDSYLWNGSTYTTSGVYTQTSMNANTCLHTDTILLTILPHPTVNFVSNQTYCALQLTQSLTLYGTPNGVNFNISGGAARGLANQIGVSSVPSFTALSGTTIVTITPIANGCIGTSTNYTLAISNCPPITLNLKFYIQGYYQGAGLMNPVMFNQGIITDPISNQVDNVIVELHSATSPFGMIKTTIATLNRNGTLTCSFNGSVTNTPYYIVIHHRNSVVTWSSVPVVMIPNATYDFSAMPSNAFGNNQVDVSTNGSIWAFYTGDINQDENVDLLDLAYLESDITSFEFGYQISDLNGDGNVDLLDNPLLEINSSDFIFSEHP